MAASILHYPSGTFYLEGLRFSIAPLSDTDRRTMVTFMSTEIAPYYREGAPYTTEEATQFVNRLIQRHLDGIPWSCYIIKNNSDEIIGFGNIGFHNENHHLHIAAFLKEGYRRRGIGKKMWRWATTSLIPEMEKQGVTVNGNPLKSAKIYATAHRLNAVSRGFFRKYGFQQETPPFPLSAIYSCIKRCICPKTRDLFVISVGEALSQINRNFGKKED